MGKTHPKGKSASCYEDKFSMVQEIIQVCGVLNALLEDAAGKQNNYYRKSVLFSSMRECAALAASLDLTIKTIIDTHDAISPFFVISDYAQADAEFQRDYEREQYAKDLKAEGID